MSAPRIGRPRRAPVFESGDRVRLKTQLSVKARTEGTATVLERHSRTGRIVVSVDVSAMVTREGYHWQRWLVDDMVLVTKRDAVAKAVRR